MEKEKGKYCDFHKNKSCDTSECTLLKKGIEEKKLIGNLSDIEKDMRSKFDADQKSDIFTIVRTHKRGEATGMPGIHS